MKTTFVIIARDTSKLFFFSSTFNQFCEECDTGSQMHREKGRAGGRREAKKEGSEGKKEGGRENGGGDRDSEKKEERGRNEKRN